MVDVIQSAIIGALIGGSFSLFTLLVTSKWRRDDIKRAERLQKETREVQHEAIKNQEENNKALEIEKRKLSYLMPSIFELGFDYDTSQKIPLGTDKYVIVPALVLKVIRGFVSEIIGFSSSENVEGEMVIQSNSTKLPYDIISKRIQESENTQYETEILQKIGLDQISSNKFYYSTQYILLKDHFGKTEWRIIFFVIDRESLKSKIELVWGEETLLFLESALPALPASKLELEEQVEVSFYLQTRLKVFREIMNKYKESK